jgi:hypothetical protein
MAQRAGRLGFRARPSEVGDWLRNRKSMPSIANIDEFHESWVKWWKDCQPRWRSVGTWPYPHDDARDMDWERLNATGPHGLFALIISASWWVSLMESDDSRAAYAAAIDDLHWALENLLHFNCRFQDKPKPSPTPATLNAGFPGHGERGTGRRNIKPTLKARTGWVGTR